MENNNQNNERNLGNDFRNDLPEKLAQEQNEWHDNTDTDKYLALEQEGVTFTDDAAPTNYSDYAENGEQGDTWEPGGDNSRNSDAFNQDDYLLNDNIDLDEEQNQSISSDDI